MRNWVKRLIFGVTLGPVAAALIAGPIVGDFFYQEYEAAIKGRLLPKEVSVDESERTASMAQGNELSERIVADGMVLLKNENNALPLRKTKESKVNLLGYHSVAWLHGGSGSGMVSPNPTDDQGMADLADSLRGYGIEVNEQLLNYYKSVHAPKANPNIDTLNFHRDTDGHRFDLYDPAIEGAYADQLDDAIDFADTAIVVIGRQGGESEDMPEIQYKNGNVIDETRHDLQISTEEEALLRFAAVNFGKTIVVINSTNAFQMDFLESIPGIDAALLIGPTGSRGAMGIAKALYAEDGFAPSGHTVDTLPYDFKQNINYEYCGYEGVSFFSNTAAYGTNQTTNAGVTKRPSLPYVDYVEGIYLGYRYYETADAMGAFNGKERILLDDAKATGYDAVVQFPFGYGLTYTQFNWTLGNISLANNGTVNKDTEIEIQVIVENDGDYDGKDVVELYMNQPYTAGGIEKSSAKLVDYAKTSILKPGETELVTLHVKARDFASYDCYDKNGNGKTTYEADAGNYVLSIRTDAHHDKAMANGEITYKIADTLIFDKDPNTGHAIDNLFTGAKAIDGVPVDGIGVQGWNIPYASRANLTASPIPQTSTHDKATGRAMSDEMLDLCLYAGGNSTDQTKYNAWKNAEEDAFGNPIELDDFTWGTGAYGIKLFESDGKTLTQDGIDLGEDYNHPDWSDTIAQITYSVARGFVSNAHPNTPRLDQIGYPATTSLDGPAQIGSFNAASSQTGVGFPSMTVLAQTWSKDLAFEVGLGMGSEMAGHGLYGVYGCGMNLHRNPFGGRNYEYFSEDPYLAGTMASNYIKGVRLMGCLPIIKHLVAAETETSRDSLYTFMSEQTLREIYLEPFRIAIAGEGLCAGAQPYTERGNGFQPNCDSLMTSYNRVGAVWAGGSQALCLGVLRNEWGFHGEVITDWSDNNQYMNLDETMTAGGSLGMSVSLRFDYSTGRGAQVLRGLVKGVVFANLRTKLAVLRYEEVGAYAGKKASSATTSEPVDWVSPLVVVINVVCFLGAAAIIYFPILGHPGLRFGKKKDSVA